MPRPKLLLWSYLIWYVFFVGRYFEETPRLWLNSLGISALIGTALVVSTVYANTSGKTRVPNWGIFRFYLMPFCVSSFAAIIKGKGFVLVFSPRASENFSALVLVLAFALVVEGLKVAGRSAAQEKVMARPFGGAPGRRRVSR